MYCETGTLKHAALALLTPLGADEAGNQLLEISYRLSPVRWPDACSVELRKAETIRLAFHCGPPRHFAPLIVRYHSITYQSQIALIRGSGAGVVT